MINNELKRVKRLVHVDIRFTSIESEQPETRTYIYRSVSESSTVVYRLINNGLFVHYLYKHKHGSRYNSS